ncbi:MULTISPECIES: hypothetical protein [unclassified Leifsonia]|uniref:hypothetical protein n=1 Tax=unclassified Leifsonia TaxID=2663824 RepID=UPI0006FECB7E|nr:MULTISPECIES: hypothetical protein [unclassified Leifsonia]KQX05435.1 hypothetical protein ASC59_15020 [Leifsonia sp. Root1293]KRA09068.1 hypothetical protein ASD61_15015 [Leifsonia sp. Root60]
MKTTFGAIGAAALLAVLLSGCTTSGAGDAIAGAARSGSAEPTAPKTTAASAPSDEDAVEPAAEAQSAVAACNIMYEPVNALASLNSPEQLAAMQADPAAGVTLMTDAATAMSEAASSVTNAEIATAAAAAATATTSYAEFLADVTADPAGFDAAAFSGQVTTFTTAMMDLQTACTS